MRRIIKIKVDPKIKFGAMARPGEITFGTHTHLLEKAKTKPTFEQILNETRTRTKKAKQGRIAAERNGEKTIKARIARLRHLEATIELHNLNRATALKEYAALQKEIKRNNPTTPREFLIQKNRIYSLTQRVRFIEELIDKTNAQAEKEKRELTQMLSFPTSPKKKIITKRRTKRKQVTLTEEKREEINGLLDSLNNAKRRVKEASNKLTNTPWWNKKEISRLLRQLKKANIDLEYIPWLLEKATKETTTPGGRVANARKNEETALREYNLASKILKRAHPEVREMRIEYLRAKRSRLYEEGRTAKQGTKERAKIDSQLREIEKEITKSEKEKARE